MNSLRFLMLSSVIVLASCATQEPAPVEFGTSIGRELATATKSSTSKEISSKKFEFDNSDERKESNEENLLRDRRSRDDKYISEDSDDVREKPNDKHEPEKRAVKEENNGDLESELENLNKDSKKEESVIIETQNKATEKPMSQNLEEKILSYPVEGKIINKFGDMVNGAKNNGINFAGDSGDPVRAAGSGTVERVMNDAKFGNTVIIKLSNSDIQTAYAHLSSASVEKGQIVSEGDVIGTLGQTGDTEMPILHFAVRKGKTPVNPLSYLK
jgi:murein DD-endopeptidase MepM/ murein hydrolase activator NlpD